MCVFCIHQRYEQLVLSGNIIVNRIVLSQLRMLCDSEETDSYKVSITVMPMSHGLVCDHW